MASESIAIRPSATWAIDLEAIRTRGIIVKYYISHCCRMVDRGLMVDRHKIETNIVHNFFCSLALTDFNNHLIFIVVDEKKPERFAFNRFCSFIRNYNISKYQEEENYAVTMHSHFSEFNDNAETLSHVTVDNGACVTTNLRQNLKVTTFLSAFLGSLLSLLQ